MRTVELVRDFAGTRVVALDIAGDEAGYSLDEHAPAFQYAVKHGIPATAHAGEAVGAESVWQTLHKCEPSRIGHGINSIQDPKLIDELRRRKIHLEICPICNVQTGTVESLEAHPVNIFFEEHRCVLHFIFKAIFELINNLTQEELEFTNKGSNLFTLRALVVIHKEVKDG